MLQNQIKTIFNSAISKIADNIDQYTFSPEKDLKRHKKLPTEKLMSFLISKGSPAASPETQKSRPELLQTWTLCVMLVRICSELEQLR